MTEEVDPIIAQVFGKYRVLRFNRTTRTSRARGGFHMYKYYDVETTCCARSSTIKLAKIKRGGKDRCACQVGAGSVGKTIHRRRILELGGVDNNSNRLCKVQCVDCLNESVTTLHSALLHGCKCNSGIANRHRHRQNAVSEGLICDCKSQRPGKSSMCVACNSRWRKYNLRPAEFLKILEMQAGLCAVCCIPLNPRFETNVDHCHKTGLVRSLLCTACNSVRVNLVENNCLELIAAADYLDQWSHRNEIRRRE